MSLATTAVAAEERAEVLESDGVGPPPHAQGDDATCPMEKEGKQHSQSKMPRLFKGWATFSGGRLKEDETHLHNPQHHCHDSLDGYHKNKGTVLPENLSSCLATGWEFGPEQPQCPKKGDGRHNRQEDKREKVQ